MSQHESELSILVPCRQQVEQLESELAQLRLEYDRLRQAEGKSYQTHLFTTVAQVANLLLRSSDYITVLPDAMRLLGEAVGSDRCGIGQIITHPKSGQRAVRIENEWCNSTIFLSKEFSPHSDQLFLADDAPYIIEKLERGEVINCLVADLPEPDHSLLAAQGSTAELFVPIWSDCQCWGFIAFDNCGEPRLYDEAEIAILKIAADALAAAIERHEKDKELLKLEQVRAQELECINTELQQTLDRLAESEQSLRALFEMSSEGFYRCKVEPPIPLTLPIAEQCEQFYQNVRVVEANPAFVAMYGADRLEDAIGMGNPDCHAEASEKNKAFIRGIVESGYRSSRNVETEEMDRLGRLRYFLNNSYCILKDGCYVGGWSMQNDITELRLSQQALLKAEQDRVTELVKTNQALKNSLDRLATEPDLNSFLGYVLLEITQQLHLDLATLWLYDAKTQTLPIELAIVQGQLKLKHEIAASHASLQLSTSSAIWKKLLQTKQPIVIDRQNSPEYCLKDLYGDRSDLQVAVNLLLTLGNEPIGLLGLASTQRTTINPEEIELAQALVQQATLAIQLTRLSQEAQQSAIYEERNRLAGEIHDTLAQACTGISVQLELLKYLLPHHSTEVSSILDRIGSLAQTGVTEARRSVWAIYADTEDYTCLAQKLANCLESLTGGTDLQTKIAIVGEPYPLSGFLATNLLRIGQEAITNTLKHAQASELTIQLNYSHRQISLCIKDNGIGFSAQAQTQGFGLISFSERTDRIGGQLRITTQPQQGTEIFVQVTL
jgi:signal transduction histidine kinase/PAS domain-containing protein